MDRHAGEEVHRSKDFLDSGEVIKFEAKGRRCELTIVDYPGTVFRPPWKDGWMDDGWRTNMINYHPPICLL